MFLEEALKQVRDYLSDFEGLPPFSFSPVHPDLVKVFPAGFISLTPPGRKPGEEVDWGNWAGRRIKPGKTVAGVWLLFYTSGAVDHPILEIVRKTQIVKNGIVALNFSEPPFTVHVRRILYDYRDNGAWHASGSEIEIGGYDFAKTP